MEKKDLQEEINQLKDVIEDLEQSNEELKTSLDDLLGKFDKLDKKFQEHNHNDFDGTKRIDSGLSKIANTGDLVSFGSGMIATQEVLQNGLTAENIMIGAGLADVFTNMPHADYNHSNIQISQVKKVTSPVALFGIGKPQIVEQTNEIYSITSSGNTIKTDMFKLKENSLAGTTIKITKNSETLLEREIVSNTVDTITIKGTWGYDLSDVGYLVSMPIMIGNSTHRWRSLSLSGIDQTGNRSQSLGITMGFNPTAQGIYFGVGVPTITANNGSIYIRSDGNSYSTLYVRSGGSWQAK